MAESNPRLDIEWLVVSALRETLSLINETEEATYNDAIRFAQENFGELFGHKDSLFGQRTTRGNEYERYAQEALATSRKESRKITADDLIRKRISTIDELLRFPENKKSHFTKLKTEKRRLNALLRDSRPRYTKVTENQALMNDFSINRPGLSFQNGFAGKYNVYKTHNDEQFVLRFLHPGAAESATGADLIYEIYDSLTERVRIIAIQYKIWENEVLYFSQSSNIESQLKRATQCFCGAGYCDTPASEKHPFRFPYCIPFLRPTDRIYDTDYLMTSGWHIPLCEIDQRVEISTKGSKILRLGKIKGVALTTLEFERMFQQEMIGSRWLTIKEAEAFYKQKKVIDPDENIIIYSQRSI
jgi:hypothetical protein